MKYFLSQISNNDCYFTKAVYVKFSNLSNSPQDAFRLHLHIDIFIAFNDRHIRIGEIITVLYNGVAQARRIIFVTVFKRNERKVMKFKNKIRK